jgi:ABC-type lipoprotein release transport system permease subunit
MFRFAWRNLWRNTRRTGITLAAVMLNTAILIIFYGLNEGLILNMVRNSTQLVVGEAQAHARGYLEDRSFYKSLERPEEAVQALEAVGVSAAPRSFGYGLVSVGSKSAGAVFWGIDPAREKATFDLPRHVMEGRFLTDRPERGAVLGRKLARSLNAEVGSEIVVVAQAADGSLGNELYTVTGIFKSAGEAIDRGAVMLNRSDFEALFVSGGRVHEIAMSSHDRMPLDDLAVKARGVMAGAEVKTWRQLLPLLADMLRIMDGALAVFGAIFFLAGGLGVMNTMLMATYERIREIGIQKALGATPLRIVAGVTVEALALALTATAGGALLGLAGTYYLKTVGLDTTGWAGEFTFSGMAFDPVWHAVLRVKVVAMPVVIMWVTCTLAALYPAVLAARLDPVRAIHHT